MVDLLAAPRLECFCFLWICKGLHSACSLWSTWNSSSECWISCWCVHILSHYTYQDGIEMVTHVFLFGFILIISLSFVCKEQFTVSDYYILYYDASFGSSILKLCFLLVFILFFDFSPHLKYKKLFVSCLLTGMYNCCQPISKKVVSWMSKGTFSHFGEW